MPQRYKIILYNSTFVDFFFRFFYIVVFLPAFLGAFLGAFFVPAEGAFYAVLRALFFCGAPAVDVVFLALPADVVFYCHNVVFLMMSYFSYTAGRAGGRRAALSLCSAINNAINNHK